MILNITPIANQYNFGQRLQTYALQTYIFNKFNINVYTVDFRELNLNSETDFNEFEKKFLNLIHIQNITSYLKITDLHTIIVGSDQIFTSLLYKKNVYFKQFFNIIKSYNYTLVSYAASANGNFTCNKNLFKSDLINHFASYKKLSFREKQDADIINKLLPNTTYHIDPVFLLSSEQWESIMKKPSFILDNEIFDFEYKIDNQTNKVEFQSDGIKKYYIYGNSNNINFKIDPTEFLWMIKNCRNYSTNSFHGNAFGIIFKKDLSFNTKRLYSIISKYHGTMRIDNLLDILNVQTTNGKIDNYNDVNKNIKIQQERSYIWLKDCLTLSNNKYAGYAKDNDIRNKSASGGVSAVLAKYVLEHNGIVYGAVYADDFKSVQSIYVSSIIDYFDKISKSKYSYCQMPNLTEVKKQLDNNILVLFTGCPCQIKKLKEYLGNKKYNNLITLDLLCNGYSRSEFLKQFIEEQELLEKSKVIKLDMRPNHTSNLYLKFENNKEKKLYNVIHKIFVCNKLNYIDDCKTCNMHTYVNSHADLTIGDFWKFNSYKQQCDETFNPKNGTNIIYINTKKGNDIFNNIKPFLNYVCI